MPARRPLNTTAAQPSPNPGRPRLRVLVMVSPERAFGRQVLEGIADYAEHNGRWQIYYQRRLEPEPILSTRFDGMIVAEDYAITHFPIRKAKVPAVSVTGPLYDDWAPSVVIDNTAVGQMGADYLINLGLRSLVYLSSPGSPLSADRAKGFESTCLANGVSSEIVIVHDGDPPRVLNELAKRLPERVGALAHKDEAALDFSRACHIVGREIPEDVAILGIDNEVETCRLADPPLSSIDHGSRHLGYEAAKMLDLWLTTGDRPVRPTIVQPVGVIARQSTDLLAIDDPDVAAAIRFIRAHVDQPIKVPDVLRHVAMARRSLEVRFRKVIGRSVREEIMRTKIDRAKHLLATSDWSMPHIVEACGFSLPSQLSFVFKRETGETPVGFRQRHRYSKR